MRQGRRHQSSHYITGCCGLRRHVSQTITCCKQRSADGHKTALLYSRINEVGGSWLKQGAGAREHQLYAPTFLGQCHTSGRYPALARLMRWHRLSYLEQGLQRWQDRRQFPKLSASPVMYIVSVAAVHLHALARGRSRAWCS